MLAEAGVSVAAENDISRFTCTIINRVNIMSTASDTWGLYFH